MNVATLLDSPYLTALPQPAPRRLALQVTRDAERQLRGGHPWLFADSILKQSHAGAAGDLAVVFDQKRRFVAIGLYDPASPLRLRVLQQGVPATIDRDWFHQQLTQAAAIRAPLAASAQTTGYRLLYGENDGLPGVVVDRYATTLVVKLYTAAWLPHLRELLRALLAVQPAERLVLRLSRHLQQRPAELYGVRDGVVIGAALHGPVYFQENGLTFEADPIAGQKTGFFLDQRENRARVEGLAAGQRVINIFAYNGGFSLYAARGGAKQVTSLDISRPALEAAQRNFALNQDHPAIAASDHHLLAGDAFDLLQRLGAKGTRYDLVIIDPPAFAKRQSEVDRALSAYAQLTRLGLTVLQPGGTLVLASCSSHVTAAAFAQHAQQAATQVGRPLQIFAQTGHALDHPIRFAEGAYLKCLYARA